jgi:hypothetical protein
MIFTSCEYSNCGLKPLIAARILNHGLFRAVVLLCFNTYIYVSVKTLFKMYFMFDLINGNTLYIYS